MIRKANTNDIGTIMTLYEQSRQFMRLHGNMTQWNNGYPRRDQVETDISQNNSYIIERAGNVVGTFAFIIGEDPTYRHIEGGHWLDEHLEYGTIHRLASATGSKGVAKECLDWSIQQVVSLRADTHADNTVVQHILEQNNFVYCGIIYVSDGTPRKAYQKLTYPDIPKEIRQYIETEIIPRHDAFDQAHQRDHILTVISNSMALTPYYPVNPSMVFVTAAFHDTGVVEGREQHHIISGRIVRSDPKLKEWFDEEQIETIAEAVEDHRASSQREPRNIYGKIVAEADRDIDKEKIVIRTIEYGQSHYPLLDKESLWRRTLQHLHEKYAEDGYLKLWLPESPNRQRLEELRALIADEKSLREIFDRETT